MDKYARKQPADARAISSLASRFCKLLVILREADKGLTPVDLVYELDEQFGVIVTRTTVARDLASLENNDLIYRAFNPSGQGFIYALKTRKAV